MKIFFNLLIIVFIVKQNIQAQDLPVVKLATLNGKEYSTNQLNEVKNQPVVLSFWATWCIPCINELSAINDQLDSWKKIIKFNLYAIATDDSRTIKRVEPLVNGKDWAFSVLLDKNQDFKRALNITGIPYTIIIKNGKIIYRHLGYVDGDENEIFKILKENQ